MSKPGVSVYMVAGMRIVAPSLQLVPLGPLVRVVGWVPQFEAITGTYQDSVPRRFTAFHWGSARTEIR